VTGTGHWERVRFGDLLELSQNGCGTRRSTSGYPTVVLRLADVDTDGSIAEVGLRQVNLTDDVRMKYALKTGDLLAFRVNGSPSIAGQVVEYTLSMPYAFCDHFIRFRLRYDRALPAFVVAAFRTATVRGQVEAGMVTSAGQNTVSQKTYASIELDLPSLNQQRRIVEKIEALTAKSRRAKDALDAIPPLLERFRQSVLAAAFRGDLTKDWREQHPDVEPADQLLARIRQERRRRWEQAELEKLRAKGKEPKNDKWKAKYKEPEPVDAEGLPELPKGWCWASIRQLVSVGTGATPKRGMLKYWEGGSIPWVSSASVNDGTIAAAGEFVTEAALRETNLSLYPAGSLVLAMYGEGKTRGKCAVLGLDATTNQALAVLSAGGIAKGILPLVRRFLDFNYERTRALAAGGAQPNLNLSTVGEIVLPLPPRHEQVELLGAVEGLVALAERIAASVASGVETHSLLDASILAKAFRGELVDPADD